jgi:IclR family KDG regulon transcriptional repressor
MKETEVYNVRAVERALQILNSFDDDHPERGVSDIAEAVGLHKATAHRILTTLLNYGFIERASNGSNYKLGVQLLDLGYRVNRRMDLRQEALPYIKQLGSTIDETIDLSVFDQGQILCVEMIPSSHALTIAASVGKRLPAYCTAGGKLFLANLPGEELAEFLQKPLLPITEFTLIDPELLRNELVTVREKGYAIDEQELELGVRAVAAPIIDHRNRIIATVSIPGPLSRLSGERIQVIIPLLLQSTQEISLRMGFSEYNPD